MTDITPTSDPIDATLTERSISAGQWRSASLLVQGGLQFGFGILLARLLPPSDFGLAALAMVVVGFVAMLAELGMGAAVVHRRPLTERHVRVAFTLALATGLAFAAALFALAPYAAAPFDNPSLVPVIRAESLLFVLTASGITAGGLLLRNLDHRRIFLVEVGGYSLGYALVAVPLALLGFGVWSLVIGTLVRAGVTSALAVGSCRHSLRPLFAMPEAREIFQYGRAASLNSVVGYVARTADSFVVGRWLGVGPLGLYTRALNVISMPISYLGSTMTGVLFPAMSEIRSETQRFRTAYLLGVQITTLIAAPICAGMVVSAPHLIVGLYGGSWRGATAPLQILAAAGVLRAVSRLADAVTYASANVMALVRRQIVATIIVLVGGALGAPWYLTGVSLGVAAATLYMYVAMSGLSLRIVAGGWREFWLAHLPGLVLGLEVAAVAAAVRWMLEQRDVPSLWILLAVVAACAAWLPAGVYFLPRRLRPAALFARFRDPVLRLPTALRLSLLWILRLKA